MLEVHYGGFMKVQRSLLAGWLTFGMALLGSRVEAAPAIGQPAPAFSVTDSQGKAQGLSQYKGKYVVLEWFNSGCPFVQKHYNSGNMQALQEKYTDRGVIWLSVLSSAPGKEGAATPAQANKTLQDWKAKPTAFLMDSDGKVGRLYGAKTTPHIFIIDPKGVLVYKGAIDDRPTTDAHDIQGAKNYLAAALDQSLAGKPVVTAATQPYGCSVKYE
jgi:peroxiredoxin